jgi:hypothetical protein
MPPLPADDEPACPPASVLVVPPDPLVPVPAAPLDPEAPPRPLVAPDPPCPLAAPVPPAPPLPPLGQPPASHLMGGVFRSVSPHAIARSTPPKKSPMFFVFIISPAAVKEIPPC